MRYSARRSILMVENVATLHLLVGKICAGKSTLAVALANAPGVVVISEDVWLSALYGAEMRSVADYVRVSARLRDAMTPHVIALLQSGLSIVLDFPANTPELRAWMLALFEAARCKHTLHVLDVSDDICRARLRRRNAGGENPFTVTDAQFDQISQYFVAPTEAEGFDVIRHGSDAA